MPHDMPQTSPQTIKVISSMATRQVLAELIAQYPNPDATKIELESVGGVDAAKRVRAGEGFDLVILAANVVEQLTGESRVLDGSRVDLVHSGISIAVRAGAAQPDISTEEAVKQAVLGARSLSYSTGPSGTHLAQLFERWGVLDRIKDRIVTPPPGIAVGSLVADGRVELGFQQLSEMMSLPGIVVLGPLPAAIQSITTFAGGVAATSARPDAARALLAFLAAPQAAEIKRKGGMEPA